MKAGVASDTVLPAASWTTSWFRACVRNPKPATTITIATAATARERTDAIDGLLEGLASISIRKGFRLPASGFRPDVGPASYVAQPFRAALTVGASWARQGPGASAYARKTAPSARA